MKHIRKAPRAIRCSICGGERYGDNNAEPYARGRCCDDCNAMCVIPMRIDNLRKGLPRDTRRDDDNGNAPQTQMDGQA